MDPAPGGSGGPREAPLGYPWAFPGPPGAFRRPPGPKTNESKKLRNVKELTEQWRILRKALAGPSAARNGPHPFGVSLVPPEASAASAASLVSYGRALVVFGSQSLLRGH